MLARFDLNLLYALDSLLREGHVSIAAKSLGVSQSTMSGKLRRLRAQMGDPLLVRADRMLGLTPRAQALAPLLRQTLLTVDALENLREDFDPARLERCFRIMASEFSLSLILPHVFRAAAKVAPRATFVVTPIDRPIESAYEGEIDLCLTGYAIARASEDMAAALRTRLLLRIPSVGLVDAGHPLDGDITLEQFLAYPHVGTQFAGVSGTVEDNGIGGLSKRHPPRIRAPSFSALGPLVVGTNAIGVAPSPLVALLKGTLPLKTLGLPSEFSRTELRMLWHRRDDRDLAFQWLRGLVLDAVTALQAVHPQAAPGAADRQPVH